MSDVWKGIGTWGGWKLTTDHPMSSYGQPVLVDPLGRAYGSGDILIMQDVITVPEAAAQWEHVTEPTLKRYLAGGKFFPSEARRAGKNWLITRQGMIRVFGEPK